MPLAGSGRSAWKSMRPSQSSRHVKEPERGHSPVSAGPTPPSFPFPRWLTFLTKEETFLLKEKAVPQEIKVKHFTQSTVFKKNLGQMIKEKLY